jgi:predicted HicB family RNase H-like nuclease
MKNRDRYLKIVEWSEEDQCYIGRCPGVMLGGVHGDSETKVIQELSGVVDEWIATLKQDRKPLPPPTAGKRYSGKFVLRIGEDLHRALAVRALQAGQSLNNYSVNVLLSTIGDESGWPTHTTLNTGKSGKFVPAKPPVRRRSRRKVPTSSSRPPK